MSNKQKRVMSHKESLKTSGLTGIFEVSHLLLEVEDFDHLLEILDEETEGE